MSKVPLLFLVLLAFCTTLLGTTDEANAHRVSIFAWVEGQKILGQGKFSNGNMAMRAKINVHGLKSGQLVWSGQTNDQGQFSLEIPSQAPREGLILKIDAGQGHQNSWEMTPDEFGGTQQDKQENMKDHSLDKSSDKSMILDTDLSHSQLAKIVRAEVAAEIAPLRKMLAEATQKEPSFTEILGGIGWLIGLAGLAAYAFGRHKA